MKKTLLSIVALALSLATGQAATIDKANISKDAKFVVHLDLDAFRASKIGITLLEKIREDEGREKLDALVEIIGFDPLTAIHGATMFGTGEEDDGIIVMKHKADNAKLLAFMKLDEHYRKTEHGKHEIHGAGDRGDGKRGYVSFVNATTAVLAASRELAAEGIDLVNGKGAAVKQIPTSFLSAGKKAKNAFQFVLKEYPDTPLSLRSSLDLLHYARLHQNGDGILEILKGLTYVMKRTEWSTSACVQACQELATMYFFAQDFTAGRKACTLPSAFSTTRVGVYWICRASPARPSGSLSNGVDTSHFRSRAAIVPVGVSSGSTKTAKAWRSSLSGQLAEISARSRAACRHDSSAWHQSRTVFRPRNESRVTTLSSASTSSKRPGRRP